MRSRRWPAVRRRRRVRVVEAAINQMVVYHGDQAESITKRTFGYARGATVSPGSAAVIGTAVAVIGACGASASAGSQGDYQHAVFRLTEHRSSHPTGERFVIDYSNPRDPAAKPVPVRHVTATLPRGARIDTGVPAPCGASDADLVARGAAACPPASRVGRGTGTVDTGFPGPGRSVAADVDVFNTRGGFLTINTVRTPHYRNVFRFK